jgi:hypothetical protein
VRGAHLVCLSCFTCIMAVNLSSKGGAVKLIFDARFRVPGERMEGVVEIDYPQARIDTIDSVEIKLTGVMSTYVIIMCLYKS